MRQVDATFQILEQRAFWSAIVGHHAALIGVAAKPSMIRHDFR
jgi:hypothetical protein